MHGMGLSPVLKKLALAVGATAAAAAAADMVAAASKKQLGGKTCDQSAISWL